MAQFGRALGSGPRGRWFKSSQPDHFILLQKTHTKDAYKTYERSIYLRLPKNITIRTRATNQREYNLQCNGAYIRHNRSYMGESAREEMCT